MNKLILVLKGGIGNQLFSYAAARRLAKVNNAELAIDSISGFIHDHKYKRKFMLNHFNISARQAKPSECLMPFERYRRFLLKWISSRKPFESKRYIEEWNNDFDERLLSFKINGTCYLDGYWQREQYFIDIENIIRQEFNIIPPTDRMNQEMATLIKNSNSVCIHIRWFDAPKVDNEMNSTNNIDKVYYNKAISLIRDQTNNPHFFVFSDYPNETSDFLSLENEKKTYISHNKGDENAFADLWLMSLCKHFIIANSTFSWWGAWLSCNTNKIIIAPLEIKNGVSAWGFKGLFPESWLLI